MKDIHNEEWIDSLTDDLEKNLSDLNAYVVTKICERIGFIFQRMKEGKSVKTATEYALQDIPKIRKAIEKSKRFTKKEIDNIFNRVAAANVDFANDFYEYRSMPKVKDYTENKNLKPIVNGAKESAQDQFRNISKTTAIGLTDKDGNFHSIRQEYIRIINTAAQAVQSGEESFYTAMRPVVRQLTKSGLRTVNFDTGDTGYSRRLDSQVRMNIQDGIRQLNQEMQAQVGKEFDADGWEISAHSLCAPDHQHIQGRQYSKKEYEELNDNLERRIGERNCKHFATPIILGVSKPVYSDKELKEAIDRSNAKVSYKGREYTRYEASQVQRQYETKLRQLKMNRDAYKAEGDIDAWRREKTRITAVTADYKRFSQAVGLKERMDRTRN